MRNSRPGGVWPARLRPAKYCAAVLVRGGWVVDLPIRLKTTIVKKGPGGT